MGARLGVGKLFGATAVAGGTVSGAIRDTNALNSNAISISKVGSLLFAAENTLNQAVSLQYQGSFDKTTFHNIGSAISVSATSGTDVQTLTNKWPWVRCVATAAASPASGTLTLHYAYNEDR